MTTQTTDLHAAIRTADDSFESTFGQGDAAGMADLYILASQFTEIERREES